MGIINNYAPFHFTNKILFGRLSTKELYNEEYEDIDTLYIDIDNAMINIKNNEPDDDKIHVKILSKRKNIKLKNYEKTLSIKVDVYEGCLFCKMNVIEISMPTSFKDYMTIKNKHGHIKIEKFPNVTMAITNKLGNVEIEEAKVAKITSSRGSINIGKASNAHIYSLWGTLDIKEVKNIRSRSTLLKTNIDKVTEYIDIKNDFGDINIKEATIQRDSEINLSLGEINIKKLNEDQGKLDKKN